MTLLNNNYLNLNWINAPRLNFPALNHPLSSSLDFGWANYDCSCVVFFHLSYLFSAFQSHRSLCVYICGEAPWWKSGQFPAAFIFSCGRGAASQHRRRGSFFNRIRRLGMSMWLGCMLSVCIIIYCAPNIMHAYIIQRGGTQSLLALKRPVNGCNFWKSCAAVWFALFDAEYRFFERLHA